MTEVECGAFIAYEAFDIQLLWNSLTDALHSIFYKNTDMTT